MAFKQQTNVQVATSIRFGSAKFEVGDDVGSLVNVGAIRDGIWEETFDKVEVMSDNAGPIELGIRNHYAFLSGNLMEINLEKLAKFYKGVHKHETVAAAPTAITNEPIVLTGTGFKAFAYRNGAATEVASIVVTNAAGVVTLVRDVDYVISLLANGFTGIARAYPAAIVTAAADISADTTDDSFNDASSDFATILAPGDHIIVAGFTDPANNGVFEVVSATNAKIIVTANLATEGAPASVTITRGGIASGNTVLVDYSYTPLASRTLKSGGITTFTPQVARFTNYDVNNKVFRATIWEATPEGGIKIDFPADADADPAMCPIRIKGRLDTTRTSGEQLWELYDEQHAS